MLRTANQSDLMTQPVCLMGSPFLGPSLGSALEVEDPAEMQNKFGELIRQLKHILGPDKGISSEDVDVNQVKKLMEDYISDESEWGKFALHDPTKNYSRNGVVDINGNANLLILVWEPSKGSAIHDHASAHCCMKILKGELVESLYEIPNGEGSKMVAKQHTTLHREDVGYISDKIGLHRISNPSTSELAVSLHLYTPPYAMMYGCSTYDDNDGHKNHVDMSKNFSWHGKILNEVESSEC